MTVSDEHAEQRLIAALRATADAVAADTTDDHSKNTGEADIVFTLDLDLDLEPSEMKPGLKHFHWLPVTVAAAVAAVIAAVAVVLAGSGPSRVQPGGPGEHGSPRPSVPYATSASPPSSGTCTDGPDGSCAAPAPTSGDPRAPSTTPSDTQSLPINHSTGTHS